MTINNLLDLHTDLLLITPTYNTATGLSLITNNEDSHDKARRLLSTLIKSRTVLKRGSLHYYNKKRPSISDSLFSYINEKETYSSILNNPSSSLGLTSTSLTVISIDCGPAFCL